MFAATWPSLEWQRKLPGQEGSKAHKLSLISSVYPFLRFTSLSLLLIRTLVLTVAGTYYELGADRQKSVSVKAHSPTPFHGG